MYCEIKLEIDQSRPRLKDVRAPVRVFYRDTLRFPLALPPHKHSSEVYVQYSVIVEKGFGANNFEPTDAILPLRLSGLS